MPSRPSTTGSNSDPDAFSRGDASLISFLVGMDARTTRPRAPRRWPHEWPPADEALPESDDLLLRTGDSLHAHAMRRVPSGFGVRGKCAGQGDSRGAASHRKILGS